MKARLSIVALCTLAGAAWLIHVGPVPVVRVTTPISELAPFWYMLLAFPVLGVLTADLFDLYRARGFAPPTLELAFQIGLIVMLSSARLGARIPLSGHALLVSYFLARRLLVRLDPPAYAKLEFFLGLAVLGAVAYPKLFWWNDPITLLTGMAGGALLAAGSRLFLHRQRWTTRDVASRESRP